MNTSWYSCMRRVIYNDYVNDVIIYLYKRTNYLHLQIVLTESSTFSHLFSSYYVNVLPSKICNYNLDVPVFFLFKKIYCILINYICVIIYISFI